MQLVPDGDARPVRQTKRRFVFQRIRMFVAAKLAPRGVEFSRHPQEIHPKPLCISRGERKMIIPPAARRQGFQLQMRIQLR
ncbi:hypothetical protein D3C76_1422690 [compost metagenome]